MKEDIIMFLKAAGCVCLVTASVTMCVCGRGAYSGLPRPSEAVATQSFTVRGHCRPDAVQSEAGSSHTERHRSRLKGKTAYGSVERVGDLWLVLDAWWFLSAFPSCNDIMSTSIHNPVSAVSTNKL